VVDFIQIPFNFPVFNVADMAISISATVIALKVIRGDRIGGKND
jgi:signal peptidase II